MQHWDKKIKSQFCCDGTNVTLLTSCSFLFNECNCQGPAEKEWWLKRNFNYFPFIFNGKQRGKNTINKRLATPDRSSVVPKEQTKLVLIKQTPCARGSHQKEGGGAVMATKLFFSYLYIQRGIWGRKKEEEKERQHRGEQRERRKAHFTPSFPILSLSASKAETNRVDPVSVYFGAKLRNECRLAHR